MRLEEAGNPYTDFTAESSHVAEGLLPEAVRAHGIALLQARRPKTDLLNGREPRWFLHAPMDTKTARLYKTPPAPHGITVVDVKGSEAVDAVYIPLSRFDKKIRKVLASLHEICVSVDQ